MPTPHSREDRVRRAAKREGYLLRKSRTRTVDADDYGMYVLVSDTAGNRRPGAQEPISAFRRGDGQPLDGIEQELHALR
ncbi:hypothetical protein CJ179_50180 [Rhodococcus sp. ACS1]|uniref:hypothetical protein n=1 Tax=Rhodococcus sp. ACS1 TaxID=2028570 RepID=UPI000BB0F3F6|nr:hypothetical protein [Rhodococcus sp. ACS1]PBC35031.1 hypothetical protein CJ179_50180 [Rhodococcus sp. ACS1]